MATTAEIHVKGSPYLTYVKYEGDPKNIIPSLQAMRLVGKPGEVQDVIYLEGGPSVDIGRADGRYNALITWLYIVDPATGEIDLYQRPVKYWRDIDEQREQPYRASLRGFELKDVIESAVEDATDNRGSGRLWSATWKGWAIRIGGGGLAISTLLLLLLGCTVTPPAVQEDKVEVLQSTPAEPVEFEQ